METTNTRGDAQMIAILVTSNKKLHSDVRKLKILLILSWVVFFVIIIYRLLGIGNGIFL